MPNSDAPPPEMSPLAAEILAYLRSHSGARDSLQGITEWWLMERDILRELRDVKKALGELVRRGWIEELPVGNEIQYRLRLPEEEGS